MTDGTGSLGRDLWISLDIETYGAAELDSQGNESPTQMEVAGNGRFHPAKSLYFDKPKELVYTCSITQLKWPTKPSDISVSTLARMMCGDTRVFLMHRPQHISWLIEWLNRSAVIVGHNIQFDIMYLRAASPELSRALNGDQLLIDTGILNYMENEVREEKSLKQLSPLFNRLEYDETAANTRFKDPEDPQLTRYNAIDTEYTAHLAKTLCRRIEDKYPESKKVEAPALSFYSEDLWTCICKSEVGVAFDVRRLGDLHESLVRRAGILSGLIRDKSTRLGSPLQISGTGSQTSKKSFVSDLIRQCDLTGKEPPILANDRLGTTEKEGSIQFNKGNITLFLEYLGETPYGDILRLIQRYDKIEKLKNSFTMPLLYHKSGKPKHRTSTIVPEYTWTSEPQPSKPPSPSSEIEEPPFTPTSYGTAQRSQTTGPCPTNCSTNTTSSEACTPERPTGYSSCCVPTSTAGTNSSASSPKSARKSKSSRKSNPSGTHPYWSTLTVRSKRKIRKEFAEWRSSSSGSSSTSSPPLSSEETIRVAYPHWYPVPQFVTDSDDNVGGTEQGRTTAKQPALQTLPYSIKKLACSRFEDGHFLAYDLSQIELRIAAVSSGEPAMIAEYHKPKPDLHGQMAMTIWGDDVVNSEGWRSGDNTKDRRQWAKEPNFLIQYWGGAYTLYLRLNEKGVKISLEECEQIIEKAVQGRPALREWQIARLQEASKNGYITACPVYGTTRSMIGDVYGKLRSTVVNCPIQTRAGHTLRAIEHRLYRSMDDLHTIRSLRNRRHLLCQQVYDAIYIDSKDPEEATGLVMEATKWVEQHGYYAKLCDSTGHFVPLVMETA